jgi:CO dehydrogenase/acetyl-CoA synthase beta subunit
MLKARTSDGSRRFTDSKVAPRKEEEEEEEVEEVEEEDEEEEEEREDRSDGIMLVEIDCPRFADREKNDLVSSSGIGRSGHIFK